VLKSTGLDSLTDASDSPSSFYGDPSAPLVGEPSLPCESNYKFGKMEFLADSYCVLSTISFPSTS